MSWEWWLRPILVTLMIGEIVFFGVITLARWMR